MAKLNIPIRYGRIESILVHFFILNILKHFAIATNIPTHTNVDYTAHAFTKHQINHKWDNEPNSMFRSDLKWYKEELVTMRLRSNLPQLTINLIFGFLQRKRLAVKVLIIIWTVCTQRSENPIEFLKDLLTMSEYNLVMPTGFFSTRFDRFVFNILGINIIITLQLLVLRGLTGRT